MLLKTTRKTNSIFLDLNMCKISFFGLNSSFYVCYLVLIRRYYKKDPLKIINKMSV